MSAEPVGQPAWRPVAASPSPRRDQAVRRVLVAAVRAGGTAGPCNTRCAARGACAFGRSGPEGGFCRQRRPPRRGEA